MTTAIYSIMPVNRIPSKTVVPIATAVMNKFRMVTGSLVCLATAPQLHVMPAITYIMVNVLPMITKTAEATTKRATQIMFATPRRVLANAPILIKQAVQKEAPHVVSIRPLIRSIAALAATHAMKVTRVTMALAKSVKQFVTA
jgi:hypothetical protein